MGCSWKGKRAASASMVGTATNAQLSDHARALAVARPMRRPVKFPGPRLTATAPNSWSRRPVSLNRASSSGSSRVR